MFERLFDIPINFYRMNGAKAIDHTVMKDLQSYTYYTLIRDMMSSTVLYGNYKYMKKEYNVTKGINFDMWDTDTIHDRIYLIAAKEADRENSEKPITDKNVYQKMFLMTSDLPQLVQNLFAYPYKLPDAFRELFDVPMKFTVCGYYYEQQIPESI